MNTLNSAVQSFACGLAAMGISAVLSWSFVVSTSVAPFAVRPAMMEHVAKSLPAVHFLASGAFAAAPTADRV